MSAPRKIPQTAVGSGSPSAQIVQTVTADAGGSSTATTFTFATLGLYDMATTTYQAFVIALGTFTLHPYVSSRTATTIVVTHDSGYSTTLQIMLVGEPKRA